MKKPRSSLIRLCREHREAWEWIRPREKGHKPLRAGIVTFGSSWTCRESFSPLYRFRRLLFSMHGIRLRTAAPDPLAPLLPDWLKTADVVLLQIHHFLPPEQVRSLYHATRAHVGDRPIVYVDGDDDAGVAFPFLAESCELYLKNQMYRDRRDYQRRFTGKNNLTDYVARTFGTDFSKDPFPHSEPLTDLAISRLRAGWNLSCGKTLHSARKPLQTHLPRRIDITLRAGLPDNWLRPLRASAAEALSEMGDDWTVVLPVSRVDRASYCRELTETRACLSPFGHGEICHRDFEAALAGCLLLKPDMSHLETRPDIFIPNETYLPLRWDYGDLAEVARSTVRDEALRLRHTRARMQILDPWLDGRAVAASLRGLLREL